MALDYDKGSQLVGLEILDASTRVAGTDMVELRVNGRVHAKTAAE